MAGQCSRRTKFRSVLVLELILASCASASTFNCAGSLIYSLNFETLQPNDIVSCGYDNYSNFVFSDGGFGIPSTEAVVFFSRTRRWFNLP
jgi:hypothetical protein